METKRCTKCKEVKPVAEFSKDKSKKDGFHNACKTCSKEKNRKWHQENTEKVREKCRKWHQENTEKVREHKSVQYVSKLTEIPRSQIRKDKEAMELAQLIEANRKIKRAIKENRNGN